MDYAPLPWVLPHERPAAVMLTSAAAPRLAGPGLAALLPLPCYCVGGATATAARAAGFGDVRTGPGTAQGLIDTIDGAGLSPVLHLAGADRTAVAVPAALRLMVVPVYAARLLPLPALLTADWVVLHSPRLAGHFAGEWDRLGGRRDAIDIAAISPAVASAAGPGWRRSVIAATPDDRALLAALAASCETAG